MRGRLIALNSNGSSRELPTQSADIRRLIDGGMINRARRRGCIIDNMQDLAVIHTVGIVAESFDINQTESLTVLLANQNARSDFAAAITLVELLRGHVGLNRAAELLGRTKGAVLSVVSPEICCLCARRGIGDLGDAVPCHAGSITGCGSRICYIKCDFVNTNVVIALAALIPCKCRHLYILLRIEFQRPSD